ncbi:hypothetical protein QJ857_gp0094 [Tupanvirus soda lake]|uniref:Apple domain-containing protein n=2 Tax=Tupanvirus TaxID=2094720 RepID=A0A6N1NNL7_9VIRU|nr:hypothetical protein QJ857_gp0094 [Tupanvirus soda lake]QKU35929.1 hypothetical protein [Tupanvirus soda lake]
MSNLAEFNRYSTYESDTDYPGDAFSSSYIANPEECQLLCIQQPNCSVWTYNTTNKECMLKSTIPPKHNNLFMVSGVISGANNNDNRNNDILFSDAPVTNNRFNNTIDNKPLLINDNPFYVSGVPVGNNNSVSTISTDTTVPYNGTPNYQQNIDMHINGDTLPQQQVLRPNGWVSQQQQTQHLIPQPYGPNRRSTYLAQTNCPGSNINSTRVPNVNNCQNLCIRDDNCKMWSFNNLNQQCFLKNQVRPCKPNSNYTSGRIIDNKPPQPHPYPLPIPYPYPLPTPQPSPRPHPSPSPMPSPMPSPQYSPSPMPAPHPSPSPMPSPMPSPHPSPSPMPSPMPAPQSSPSPMPAPQSSPSPMPPQTLRISTTLNGVSFPWQAGNRHVYAKNVDECKDTCVRDTKCGKWSYTPQGFGPSCTLEESRPHTIYHNPSAQSGEIYLQRPYPDIIKSNQYPGSNQPTQTWSLA